MNKKVIACVLIVIVGILGFVGYKIYDKMEHERIMQEIRDAEASYNYHKAQLEYLESLQDALED